MQQLFTWLESTELARTVGESLSVTASLSALHVLGYTLVMSGGVVWSLRAAGLVLPTVPAQSVARPAYRLVLVGLAISLLTGFALFAPRASYTAPGGVFQLKMTLIVIAAIFQLSLSARVLRGREISTVLLRAAGATGLLLWLALAVSACWFILFE